MPEATTNCPNCGNEIASGSAFCPHCGARQAPAQPVEEVAAVEAAPAVNRYKEMLDAVLATTKTHKWWWAGGGGGAVVVIVLVVLFVFGVFGPSGRAICMATLAQAKDFGVISPSATLSSSWAKSTDVDGRKQCSAEVGSDSYVLQADVKSEDAEHKKCKDFEKQADCLKLYSVARSDGMTTYQVREIPPNETDEAILAGEAQNGVAPGAAPPAAGGSEPGALDAPTAVDNGAGDQTVPEQTAPTQTEPGEQPQ